MGKAKILVLGDTHGNKAYTVNWVQKTARLNIDKIVQVGDFGLWTHLAGGITFLDSLNEICREKGKKFYALGGNHENWDHWNWAIDNLPKDKYGFTMLRSHVMIAPRVHSFIWHNKKFLMVAGAASVDKQERLKDMRNGRPQSWWPQEQITDEEVDAIPERKVDYLFTHDCSNATPWGFKLIPDLDSQIHRQRIDRVISKSAPEMHFHGHMHKKYVWKNMANTIIGPHRISTYGLSHDSTSYNWGVLDCENDQFELAPWHAL
jgi:predicted phosphodiesterase